MAVARSASAFVFDFVSGLSAVIVRNPLSLGAVLSLRKSLNRYAPRIRPSMAAPRSMSDRVVMTASAPFSDRAATPAARRITSAGHSSRLLPSPTASTLATGSDGATTRVTCSEPPLAPSAARATSISPTASASRNVLETTAAAPSSSCALTTATISTESSTLRLGSDELTVTVGTW